PRPGRRTSAHSTRAARYTGATRRRSRSSTLPVAGRRTGWSASSPSWPSVWGWRSASWSGERWARRSPGGPVRDAASAPRPPGPGGGPPAGGRAPALAALIVAVLLEAPRASRGGSLSDPPPLMVVDLHVDLPWQVHFKRRSLALTEGHATLSTLA